MSMILNHNARQALTAGHLAHLVTLNPDGSPQVSVVWVGLEGDEIVCAHLRDHKKLKNIREDARVALPMVTGGRNAAGLDNYLVVTGRARVTEGGAAELLQRLAHIYIGPNLKFPPMDNPPSGWITRIAAESVYGVGPWGAGG